MDLPFVAQANLIEGWHRLPAKAPCERPHAQPTAYLQSLFASRRKRYDREKITLIFALGVIAGLGLGMLA